MQVGGYQTLELINEGRQTFVFRGQSLADKKPVTIKLLKEKNPPPEAVERLQHEYDVLSEVGDLPGVTKALDFIWYDNRPALVVEDFGGIPLGLLADTYQQSLEKFFELAIALTEILDSVHQRGIIHKDINPANILINKAERGIKLADFGMASFLQSESISPLQASQIEGALPYISPEQTGRMNRLVDFRTDFYSLGIVFYELLTGKLPFFSTDPLEIIHAHMACPVPSPAQGNTAVPEALAAVVLKLLSKAAEDRFQSGAGLLADLKYCQQQLLKKNHIDLFPLAQKDRPSRLQLSQKLYGRETELATIQQHYQKVMEGHQVTLLIGGQAGIGKTALVGELQKHIAHDAGFFVSGKFQQGQSHLPYAPLLAAFRILIRQLLASDETMLMHYRQKLLKNLGLNAGIVCLVLPELEKLIGKQVAVPDLSMAENENRFRVTLQNFVATFAQKNHPLVLVLDDLQWADPASISLLSDITLKWKIPGLFLIGSMREDEVGQTHPLAPLLGELHAGIDEVYFLSLNGLDPGAIRQYLADGLRTTSDSVAQLASTLNRKTLGNPFYLGEFLRSLYADKILTFDTRTGKFCWQEDKVSALGSSKNVVELLVNKIQKLPSHAQDTLRMAACLGSEFDLEFLYLLVPRSRPEAQQALTNLINAGMILPIGDAYRLLNRSEEYQQGYPAKPIQTKSRCRFVHDKILQAANSLLTEDQSQQTHLKIARLLQAEASVVGDNNHLFEMVEHYNLALSLISAEDERQTLAQLNLEAGHQAKAAAAYQTAYKYYRTGLQLLPAETDAACYQEWVALQTGCAETSYLCGDAAATEEYVQAVIQYGKTTLDRLRIYDIQVQALNSQNKMLEALAKTREGLLLVGIRFPDNPGKLRQLFSIVYTQLRLWWLRNSLHKLAGSDNPLHLLTIRLLASGAGSAYVSSPDLVPVFVTRSIGELLKHGHTPQSGVVFSAFSMILCGGVSDIRRGYEVARFAQNLPEAYNSRQYAPRTAFLAYVFAYPWQQALHQLVEPLKHVYRQAIEVGDFELAALSGHMAGYHGLIAGQPLKNLEKVTADFSEKLRVLNQERHYHNNELILQCIQNLQGKVDDPCSLNGLHFDEKSMLPKIMGYQDKTTLFDFYLFKAIFAFLFGKNDSAIRHIEEATLQVGNVFGITSVTLCNFMDSLIHLRQADNQRGEKRRRSLVRVNNNQRTLRGWMKLCPVNQAARYHLVAAESSRLQGEELAALGEYDQAIEAARKHKNTLELALSQELAGAFYQQLGHTKVGEVFLLEAANTYRRFGVMAKVNAMVQQYPQSFGSDSEAEGADGLFPSQTRVITQSRLVMDLQSTVKSARVLSETLELDDLLTKMMQIVMENAGAQRGFFITDQGGELMLRVAAEDGGKSIHIQTDSLLSQSTEVSIAAVQYVARSGTYLVLEDANQEKMFLQDPYIQNQSVRSLLCVPVMHQGKLQGILYLENNLTTAAFTTQRLELLHILIAQAAIALENAQDRRVIAEERDKTQSILSSMGDALFTVDRLGRIQLMNPTCLQWLGIDQVPAGEKIADYLKCLATPSENSLTSVPVLRQLLAEQKPLTQDKVKFLAQTNHTQRSVSLSAAPIVVAAGQSPGVVYILHDRSDQEQLEQAKLDFITTAGHELRTPLTAIRMGLEVLFDGLPLPEKILQYRVDQLRNRSEHMKNIINALLAATRLQAEGIKTTPGRINLNRFLEQAIESKQAAAQSKSLELRLERPTPTKFALANQELLSEILGEFIDNAIRFTEQGKITVAQVSPQTVNNKNFRKQPLDLEGRVIIAVSDTGCGIDQASQQRVFGSFFQQGGSLGRQQEKGGLGLGLYLANQRALTMGIPLWFESVPGEGSTFYLAVREDRPEKKVKKARKAIETRP